MAGNKSSRRTGLSPRGRGNLPCIAFCPTIRRSIPAWAGEPCLPRNGTPKDTVYPRVGGGTTSTSAGMTRGAGLSPRGRGNPWRGRGKCGYAGSIPAWAGEPFSPVSPAPSSGVYPRVGGGTLRTSRGCPGTRGLSPRGRGNRAYGIHRWGGRGSIPAWAGEPSVTPSCSGTSMVYPRVGGGT